MSGVGVRISYNVNSVNGSQANGPPVRIGGNLFNVQTRVEGDTLSIIEVSNDKARWVASSTGLGNALTAITTRPMWARGAVATDTSAVRGNQFDFIIFKDAD